MFVAPSIGQPMLPGGLSVPPNPFLDVLKSGSCFPEKPDPVGETLRGLVGAARHTMPAAAAAMPADSPLRGTQPVQGDRDLVDVAEAAYDFQQATAGGYTRLSNAEVASHGIDPALLQNTATGFKAGLYANAQGQVVIAFAGTDGLHLGDWQTNVQQGLHNAGGLTDQYRQAGELAQATKGAFGDDLVGTTGHSQGGALALTAAAVTGRPAVTFNSAGLSDTTLRHLDIDPGTFRAAAEAGQARNYVVNGDILTGLQDGPALKYLVPQVPGTRIELEKAHGPAPAPKSPAPFGVAIDAGVPGAISEGVERHMLPAVKTALDEHLAELKPGQQHPDPSPTPPKVRILVML